MALSDTSAGFSETLEALEALELDELPEALLELPDDEPPPVHEARTKLTIMTGTIRNFNAFMIFLL